MKRSEYFKATSKQPAQVLKTTPGEIFRRQSILEGVTFSRPPPPGLTHPDSSLFYFIFMPILFNFYVFSAFHRRLN